MDVVSLKIAIANSGTRRLNINRQTPLESFESQIKGLFDVQSSIDWKYIDEENDEVTFSTPQEWIDVIQNWPSDRVLKLFGVVRQQVIPPQQFQQQQRGSCCAAFPTRFIVQAALLYSIFAHPLLTLIGIVTALVTTYHHYPSTFERLMDHGAVHWRKLAFAFGLRLLFSFSFCTLLFVVPIGFILYRKAKRCSNNGCNVRGAIISWLYKLKTRIQQFTTVHNIQNGEDICKFACNLVQGRKCPRAAPQVQQINVEPTKQPSAPEFNEIYPQVNAQVPAEPFLLPQRVESSQFVGELDALHVMGFENKKLNEHLLRNFNGDLDRVINSLLQLSAMK